MKLVQIQLRPSVPFWFLRDMIMLNMDNRTSDFINIDSLDSQVRRIINLSILKQEINVLDFNGIKLNNLDDAKFICGDLSINTDDINDDSEKDLMPEIISVTTEDIEEKPKEEKLPSKPSQKHIENAKILLEQNGNTVKKMVKNIKKTEDNFMLLIACLDIEKSNKKRKGIIIFIESAMVEYLDGR